MTIIMHDGRIFRVIRPSAFGKKPTLAYENGLLSFLARGYPNTVTVNMSDIALVE